jgi:DedD protein
MALPSFFKRKDSQASAPPPSDPLVDEAGPVQAARARARRRLIGAVVLLAIGVLVFPLLFETQPRPLQRDIPIELPRRDAAAPKAPAAARNVPALTELPVADPAPPASAAVVGEAQQPPAAEPPPAARPAPAAPAEPRVAASKPEPPRREAANPEPPKPAERPALAAQKAEDERARAALEGRSGDRNEASASAAAGAKDDRAGRFVVQVGAYTDPATLREVRAKVEKLGLKTYTQAVDTDAGKRTRVRVGPFATRQEADGASGKLKAAGLPGNVLVL